MIGLMWATMTSVGTATTETQLNGAVNLIMPDWARSIVAVTPYFATDVLDGDLSAIIRIILKSNDVDLNPYQILTNPCSGYDATTGQPHVNKVEKFPANIPLKGGEQIEVWGTSLAAFTGPIYGGVTLTISDRKLGRQKFGMVGTLTASGTAAAEVAGTQYSIHGSEQIVEVYGAVMDEVKAAANALFGSFRLASGDYKVATPCSYNFQPISGAIGTVDGPYIPGIVRCKVNIPTNKTCVIQDYCTFDLAPTAGGTWVTAVMYEKYGK